MGLFGKKEPCAICGEKVKGLFPWRIEGQLVCNLCHGATDLPNGLENTMTMADFRDYIAFREENDLLKQKFNIMQEIDFGWFDTKFVFDFSNRLFCMDKNLGKTVFEGKHIKSFVIKEDTAPLFEGNAAGLRQHKSHVPERLITLAPQIERMRAQEQMRRNMEELADAMNKDRQKRYVAPLDIPEPFKAFNVEIRLQHPYWSVIRADMSGPTFSNSYPDVNDYTMRYNDNVLLMEQLAMALMDIAFPDVSSDPISADEFAAARIADRLAPSRSAPTPANVDVVEELQRYKSLLDMGILTEEEFSAKKRQLLGI